MRRLSASPWQKGFSDHWSRREHAALYLAGALLIVLSIAGVLAAGPTHAQGVPAITIEPHQAQVTGNIDWINDN